MLPGLKRGWRRGSRRLGELASGGSGVEVDGARIERSGTRTPVRYGLLCRCDGVLATAPFGSLRTVSTELARILRPEIIESVLVVGEDPKFCCLSMGDVPDVHYIHVEDFAIPFSSCS